MEFPIYVVFMGYPRAVIMHGKDDQRVVKADANGF